MNCANEVSYKGGRPACLKHLCFVRLLRICDDWTPGGAELAHLPGTKSLGWVRDDTPTLEQIAFLDSQKLTSEE
jgi:hypothetical protein